MAAIDDVWLATLTRDEDDAGSQNHRRSDQGRSIHDRRERQPPAFDFSDQVAADRRTADGNAHRRLLGIDSSQEGPRADDLDPMHDGPWRNGVIDKCQRILRCEGRRLDDVHDFPS